MIEILFKNKKLFRLKNPWEYNIFYDDYYTEIQVRSSLQKIKVRKLFSIVRPFFNKNVKKENYSDYTYAFSICKTRDKIAWEWPIKNEIEIIYFNNLPYITNNSFILLTYNKSKLYKPIWKIQIEALAETTNQRLSTIDK